MFLHVKKFERLFYIDGISSLRTSVAALGFLTMSSAATFTGSACLRPEQQLLTMRGTTVPWRHLASLKNPAYNNAPKRKGFFG